MFSVTMYSTIRAVLVASLGFFAVAQSQLAVPRFTVKSFTELALSHRLTYANRFGNQGISELANIVCAGALHEDIQEYMALADYCTIKMLVSCGSQVYETGPKARDL
jgi:hypothetical protein